jgi:hypothetical protein
MSAELCFNSDSDQNREKNASVTWLLNEMTAVRSLTLTRFNAMARYRELNSDWSTTIVIFSFSAASLPRPERCGGQTTIE